MIKGAATLDGALNIALINGFVPASGNQFQIITFTSRTGDFATKTGLTQGAINFDPQYDATSLTLKVP